MRYIVYLKYGNVDFTTLNGKANPDFIERKRRRRIIEENKRKETV